MVVALAFQVAAGMVSVPPVDDGHRVQPWAEAGRMSEVPRPLILDLVADVAGRPRPYAEVMEAWRTSCPRLTVWEDAVDAGLVVVRDGMVGASPAGLSALRSRRGPG